MRFLPWLTEDKSKVVLVKVDGKRQLMSKKIHDFLESFFVKPTSKNPKMNYCNLDGKTFFDDQRAQHDEHMEEVDPLIGKMFTETDSYFEAVEKEADGRGVLPW